jgi:hypothetical protein
MSRYRRAHVPGASYFFTKFAGPAHQSIDLLIY